MSIHWETWAAAAFERAARQRKAVVAFLYEEGSGPGPWEALWRELAPLVQRYVWVRVGLYERPDVVLRYAACGLPAAVLLGPDGRLLWSEGPDHSLRRFAEALERHPAGKVLPLPPAQEGPVWTGAVARPAAAALDPAWPRAVVKAVQALPQPGFSGMELLLYAVGEWGDAAARRSFLERLPGARPRALAERARRARLLWDAFALEGSPALRAAAAGAANELADSAVGGLLPHAPGTQAAYGASNAAAALALLRAAAFEPAFAAAAESLLAALRRELYDPLLGILHVRGEGGSVYGLLEDNAWAALAFTEAFLMTGKKEYRDFADELGRFLFQEFWEREGGAFIDRVPRPDDVGLLKSPRLDPETNAVAFEAVWRLSELKGNANYRRWIEMGLKRLIQPGAVSAAFAGLARIQDMLSRGRLDLELVGRLDDACARELLRAVHGKYLPRKVISFVDPDDQDYIQAHKLSSSDLPRLFACVNLQRVADTGDPAQVGDILAALQKTLGKPS